MTAHRLQDITWYVDRQAIENGEPGIYHSYMASLATALNYVEGDVDPAWLMGASAFAFRMFVCETLCPSAMSCFNWDPILPEAVEQAGYECIYVSRMWEEDAVEKERREKAHTAIVEGISRGVPAVVWDVAGCEWGLIVGYDENGRFYNILTSEGKPSSLAHDKLGRNGIDILSVAITGESNGRSREEIVLNSLQTAVAHADQKEWMERPTYENGLAAFDMWATLYDRWALLVGSGRGERIRVDLPSFSNYHAGHAYSARCYARDYLKANANGNEYLVRASSAYERVAANLMTVWVYFSKHVNPTDGDLTSLAQSVRSAKEAEVEGIDAIRAYLASRVEEREL